MQNHRGRDIDWHFQSWNHQLAAISLSLSAVPPSFSYSLSFASFHYPRILFDKIIHPHCPLNHRNKLVDTQS